MVYTAGMFDPLPFASLYRFSNQYFYSESVGTYLIEREDMILLLDLPTYSTDIATYLQGRDKPIKALLSHGSCGIEDGSRWQDEVSVEVYLHAEDRNHNWLRMQPDVFFTKTDELDLGEDLEVIHTPGHSTGSICLLDHKTKALCTGDTFGGTTDGAVRNFHIGNERDDIPRRVQSCRKLLSYDFKHVLPFHYEVILDTGKEALKVFDYTIDTRFEN